MRALANQSSHAMRLALMALDNMDEDFTLTKDTRALIVKTRYNNYGYWLFFSMAIVDALAKDHFVTTDDCESDEYDVLFNVESRTTGLDISIDMSR